MTFLPQAHIARVNWILATTTLPTATPMAIFPLVHLYDVVIIPNGLGKERPVQTDSLRGTRSNIHSLDSTHV